MLNCSILRCARQLSRLVLLAFSLPVLVLAGLAHADGLYMGAGAYLADLEIATGEEDDFTPAAFVGYQFFDSPLLMLSAELGYYDLGAASGNLEGIRYSVDAEAVTLAGVAYLPIGPFIEVYAKAGAGRFQVDSRILDEAISDDSTDVFFGAGIAWDIFDTIDIYAEVLRFDNDIDSQMLGVGIRLDLF